MGSINKTQRVNAFNNEVSDSKNSPNTFISGRSWKKIGHEVAKGLAIVALVISTIAYVALFIALGAINLHLTARLNGRYGFFLGNTLINMSRL